MKMFVTSFGKGKMIKSFVNTATVSLCVAMASCGTERYHSTISSTTQCKYGVKITQPDMGSLDFYDVSRPKRTNKCPLPAGVFLCSEEPVRSTDGGFELKLLPGRNMDLTQWSASQSNDCVLLSLIAWKELRSSVAGRGLEIVGPVITPTPIPAPPPPPVPVPTNPSPGGGNLFSPARIFNEALKWPKQYFRAGFAAQCANFVRQVLASSCNKSFSSEASDPIQSFQPWDANVVGTTSLSYGYANSLAGSEIGLKVSLSEARPGDLVFFRNTYGNWPTGTITHIGIYAGDETMIDRPTFNGPVMYRKMNMSLFTGALRVHRSLCNL